MNSACKLCSLYSFMASFESQASEWMSQLRRLQFLILINEFLIVYFNAYKVFLFYAAIQKCIHSCQKNPMEHKKCHKNWNIAGVLKFFPAVLWLSTIKLTGWVQPFVVCALVLRESSKRMALTRAHWACQQVIKYAWVSKCPAHPVFANGQCFGQWAVLLIYRDHRADNSQYRVF